MTLELGIFTNVFPRATLGETLAAVRGLGLGYVQLSLRSAGLAELPEQVGPAQVDEIRRELDRHAIRVAGLSGTFNMAHPDPAERAAGLRGLRCVAEVARAIGAASVTLCSGTRDRQSMWRAHPDNGAPEAWADMLATMRAAAAVGEELGVVMAVEPEVSNVVDSAARARAMLDAVGSPALKIVIDGANLFHHGELPRMGAILDEAFALLGGDMAFAHAKDLDRDGEAGHLPAGQGLLDYPRYVALLRRHRVGPLVAHGLSEQQAPAVIGFLRAALAG